MITLPDVIRFRDIDPAPLVLLLARFGMTLGQESPDRAIRGSFWGDEEAGLIGSILVLREDTPLHSILHEACHYICLDHERREGLIPMRVATTTKKTRSVTCKSCCPMNCLALAGNA